MNKLAAVTTLATLALSLSALATEVTFGAATSGTQRRVVLSDGVTQVTSGSLVYVGAFSSPNLFTYNSSLSVAANFSAMLSDGFTEFGYAQPGNGAFEASSYTLGINSGFSAQQVSGSIIDDTGALGSGTGADYFDNKQLYIAIFNSTTVSGSTQMGVFTSTSWLFPTNTTGGDGTDPSYSTSTAVSISAVGNAGSVNTSPNNQLELVAPTPTPEPTATALLGSVALATLLVRRRRTA